MTMTTRKEMPMRALNVSKSEGTWDERKLSRAKARMRGRGKMRK